MQFIPWVSFMKTKPFTSNRWFPGPRSWRSGLRRIPKVDLKMSSGITETRAPVLIHQVSSFLESMRGWKKFDSLIAYMFKQKSYLHGIFFAISSGCLKKNLELQFPFVPWGGLERDFDEMGTEWMDKTIHFPPGHLYIFFLKALSFAKVHEHRSTWTFL